MLVTAAVSMFITCVYLCVLLTVLMASKYAFLNSISALHTRQTTPVLLSHSILFYFVTAYISRYVNILAFRYSVRYLLGPLVVDVFACSLTLSRDSVTLRHGYSVVLVGCQSK